MKKFSPTLLFFIYFLILVALTAWILRALVLRSDQVPTATLPPNDEVPIVSTTPLVEFKALSLLGSKTYTPSPNVYSDSSVYERESTQLALNGEFESAKLIIEGTVNGEGPYLVSINFSTESGVLNGIRNSQSELDLYQTQKSGGVFTKESGIKFALDLMGKTALATTNKEFIATRQLSKSVRLWDYLIQPPPTIARVLIAPFNQKGIYGGATITKINFEYTCNGDSNCGAEVCDYKELENKCIQRYFGNSAEAIYRKSVGL